MSSIRLPTRYQGLLIASRSDAASLVALVRQGLCDRPQPWLPAAWLYDDRGSALFDRICELPEYYATRTELALLTTVAPEVARVSQADELVELGSGLARKTHLLLAALGARTKPVRWVPFDLSEVVLLESARRMLEAFPALTVQGVLGDFTRDLGALSPGRGRRLVAFLGGTIGNFDEEAARVFLRRVAGHLAPEDHLLLASDLVKDRARLHAAYNDSEGVTAAFNLNTLERLKRELNAEVELDAFGHDAFFDEATSRIEMHARARRDTTVQLSELALRLAKGESIRTEISRKLTPEGLEKLLREAGLEVVELWQGDPPYALALARRR